MSAERRPRVVGLVGGIGSGKSTAARMLGELGAAVIHADLVGHEVYRPGSPGFAEVTAAFGPSVVAGDGSIDRGRLGAIVFGDPAALEQLNRIVHPLIRAELERRVTDLVGRTDVPLVVVEAAILLEAGWRDLVDEVWVISAGREAVVERLAQERGLDRDAVLARMARQMPDAERRAAAERVIDNRGTLEELGLAMRSAFAAATAT